MKNSFDTLTVTLSSGLPRRQIFKALAGGILATVSGGRVGATASTAAGIPVVVDGKRRVVVLHMLRGTITSQLVIPDRGTGSVTLPGQPKAALVPHILDEGGVELSVYEASTMALSKRVTLGLRANAVSIGVPFLSDVSFAATEVRLADLPADYDEQTDCCASCCWGGSLCACSACCDTSTTTCGYCCDSGCCPACDPH